MSEKSHTFRDVAEFFSFSGEQAESFTLRGLIKEHQESEWVFFSPTMLCTDWIAVEKAAIKEIEFLGHSQCSDHLHPIVSVTFGNAQSNSLQGLRVIRSLIARNNLLARSIQSVKATDLSQIKLEYVGPCGAAWTCANGQTIFCSSSGKPYENINTNECYCIAC